MPRFSLQIPLAIPPPIFSPETRMPSQPLSLHHCTFSTHHSSPLIFPRNFLIHSLDISHAHLLTLDMLTTQFSSLGLMILSAACYIFSNIWHHEVAFSSMDLHVNSSQSMHLFQSPSLLLLIPSPSATALIVLPFFYYS